MISKLNFDGKSYYGQTVPYIYLPIMFCLTSNSLILPLPSKCHKLLILDEKRLNVLSSIFAAFFQPEVSELSGRCRRFFDNTAPRILNEYLSKEPTKVFTLCHGDFW
jgi:hypothetical protein